MTVMMDTETGGKIRRDNGGCIRCVFFLLGVFLAASIALSIALGVTLVKDKDDDANTAVTSQAIGNPTQSPGDVTQRPGQGTHGLCTSSSCVLRAGELLQAMDRSVDPCVDFYQYSCGKWEDTHSIPESESSFSRFGEIENSVKLELKGLLEKPYDSNKEGQPIRKLKNLYQSCLNESKLDELGPEPLKQLVEGMFTWPLTSPGGSLSAQLDLESLLTTLGNHGLSPLVDLGVGRDVLNSSAYILWVDQASLGIDRDYMVEGRSSEKVMTYETFLRQLAVTILNLTDDAALKTAIGNAVQFEVDVANLTATRAQRRNVEEFYQRMTVRELQVAVPKLNWLKYLTGYMQSANITFTDNTVVALFARDYLNNVIDLYNRTDKKVVANYFLVRLLRGYYMNLNKATRDLYNPLRQVLYGVSQPQARWKSCVDDMANMMPTATGLLYVTKYFTSTAKDKALEMIGYIRTSIKQMIRDVTWMDQATKDVALEKADAILELIGYPEYQFNVTYLNELYDEVDYTPDAFFQNALINIKVGTNEGKRLLNKEPSRKDWSDAASTVNAFYSSTRNTITFPAGILQPPFYGEDFPMSMTFGGIGMVIGHEITHGFDDQGRKYDKVGNNIPWWSNSSVQKYEQLTQCFIDQYGEKVVATGEHVNGHLTLGENIADNGGIKASFQAFQMWQSHNQHQPDLPGLNLTHQQLFFVNFAQGWCTLITDEAARDRVLTDPHSPADVRVRVPVSNSRHFAEAFQCRPGTPMNPTKKCELW